MVREYFLCEIFILTKTCFLLTTFFVVKVSFCEKVYGKRNKKIVKRKSFGKTKFIGENVFL